MFQISTLADRAQLISCTTSHQSYPTNATLPVISLKLNVYKELAIALKLLKCCAALKHQKNYAPQDTSPIIC